MALMAGLLLLLLALLLGWLSSRLQRRTGLPAGRLRYQDVDRGQPLQAPLLSHRYRLTGRPDYLLEQQGQWIPVEIKPKRQARQPYASDIMQLAAYCLLVEETYGSVVPYGILRYARQSWEIPFDDRLRAELLALLESMDDAERATDVPRSHERPERCRGCSQRARCDQSLLTIWKGKF